LPQTPALVVTGPAATKRLQGGEMSLETKSSGGTHSPLDACQPPQPDQEETITARVAEIAARRAVIEQAKGMLMLVYGIGADAAFQLLRWQSQHHNVKLRRMAEQITRDFGQAAQRRPHVDRRTYDELLVTAHTRTGTPLLTDAVEDMAARMSDADGG
jgi:hypothetical protein